MNDSYKFVQQIYDFVLAMFAPSMYALLGRAAHWAHHKKKISLAEMSRECFIIMFMGAVSGGLAETLGFTNSKVSGAFIAATSFYGPKLVVLFIEYFFGAKKFDVVKRNCDVEILAVKEADAKHRN